MGLQRGGRALLTLNARQIGELVAELRPLVAGWRVRDVAALPPRDLVLVLEPPAGAGEGLPPVRRLRLSADPEHSRLHLQVGRVERHKGPAGPFYRRLEEELAGASLRGLTQVRGDRIVCLELRDTPSGEPRGIFAELTGRHANLVLTGRGERVLDVLVPAAPGGAARGAPRLVEGAEWSPPPGRPPAAATLPSVVDELGPAPEDARGAPLSLLVERALSGAVDERDRERAQRQLEKRAERKLGKARSLLRGLERRLEACDEAERVRMDGELVAANAHRLQRGASEAVVEDWYVEGAPTRRIELDPKRGPQENAARLFERYKKLERARRELPAEIARATTKIARLEELLAGAADPERDPAELEAEAVRQGLLDPPQEPDERKRKPPPPRLPYRAFTASRGSEVRVGRNARDNDALTFRHARGNDVWLHTADAAGSHVVLCMAGRPEPDPEELLDAAHLAVHFSPLRDAKGAAVHVCRRKEVHKPRGAKPGLVTVAGGRRLQLRLQPERLARLLSPDRARARGEDPESGE